MEITRKGATFADARGEIVDVLTQEHVDYVTLIRSVKGAVRGNHYHKDTFQWVYMLSGRIRVVAQEAGKGIEEKIISAGDLLLNRPFEGHAFEALEDSEFVVLTRGPRGGENYESDTYRLDKPLIVAA